MISPLKLILREALLLQHRRVNSLQDKIVLSAREIQKTKTVYVTLIFRRDRYLNTLECSKEGERFDARDGWLTEHNRQ
jgi:hypothetical protein